MADLVDQQGCFYPSGKKPRAGNSLRVSGIRKDGVCQYSELVEALKGIDVLLMVSAQGKSRACWGTHEF